MRQFSQIMEENGYFRDANWNKTDFIYTFPTGSKIEFFSADQPDKVRGPRRDMLFINEANNVPYKTFEELEIRTRKFIWLDFNPVAEFWAYTELKEKRPDEIDWIKLTYRDNEACPSEIVKAIEAKRENKNWWRVYGEGELGEAEGRIYTGWKIINEIPHEARLERYGLDFGYVNNPTAIIAVYRYQNGFILDEITYQTGLSNREIADILLNIPKVLVIADSAEPKSIDEIKSYGVNILPSEKGRDSVRQGIQLVKDQRISVTKRSLNVIKEYRNYMWLTDKDGNIINEPQPYLNHAMDAIRYAIVSLVKVKRITEEVIKEFPKERLFDEKGFY